MKPVLCKKDFVKRYQAGEFGNASPSWDSIPLWCQDPLQRGPGLNGPKLYHFRNRIPGGATYYNLTVNKGLQTIPRLEGHLLDYYVSEMAPTHKTLIQGEVCRTPISRGLYFYYSKVVAPMREALAEDSDEVAGVNAVLLLKNYLNPLSYDWLQHLLDNYENHTIELSVYDTNWGTLPGYNTVFWEVRKY